MSSADFLDWTLKYSEVLMNDDRELSQRMVDDLNIPALETLGTNPSETLILTLIYQQQMMIDWLGAARETP